MQLVKTVYDAQVLASQMSELLFRVDGVFQAIDVTYSQTPHKWFGVTLAYNRRDLHVTGLGLDPFGPNFTCDKLGEEVIWPNRQHFNRWVRKYNDMFAVGTLGMGVISTDNNDLSVEGQPGE